MTRLTIRLSMFVLPLALTLASASRVAALTPQAPAEILVAEMAGRWDEAADLCRAVLAEQPERLDLWLRLADIEARREDLGGVADALEGAIRADPGDPALRIRLARLHSERGDTAAARRAAADATRLAPSDPEPWRLSALYAAWEGDSGAAADDWRRVLELDSGDPEATLGLARALSWLGEIDDASRRYRAYLDLAPDDRTARLEYARIESWRGAYPRALEALEEYRRRFGEDPELELERLDVLARAGRPRRVLEPLEGRLAAGPDDDDSLRLEIAYALALEAADRPADSLRVVRRIEERWPGDSEAEEISRWLRAPHRTRVTPAWSLYSDSDDLRRNRFSAHLEGSPRADLRLGITGERVDLSAPVASGLATPAGIEEMGIRRLRFELTARPVAAFEVTGSFGRTETREVESPDEWTTWGLSLGFRLGDRGHLHIGRSSDLTDISPRSAALGILTDEHRLRLELDPGLRSHLSAAAGWDRLSDGNRRWEALLAPRWAVARREIVNLDLGARAWGFGFDRDLANGYFDPERFERYSLALYVYLKLADQVGLSIFAAGGWERTTAPGLDRSFEPGGQAALELSAGIFADWMLELTARGSSNQRSETGAFEATSYQVAVTRRF